MLVIVGLSSCVLLQQLRLVSPKSNPNGCDIPSLTLDSSNSYNGTIISLYPQFNELFDEMITIRRAFYEKIAVGKNATSRKNNHG